MIPFRQNRSYRRFFQSESITTEQLKIIKKNIISNAIDVSNLNVGFYYFYIGNQIIKFIKE